VYTVARVSPGLPLEIKGGMELNYPHCPSICPPLAAHPRRSLDADSVAATYEYRLISFILRVLRCDKISVHTGPLKG
jgi:hypothetical protein